MVRGPGDKKRRSESSHHRRVESCFDGNGTKFWQEAVCEKDGKGDYKLELLVSFEIMLSETARFADLVLPDKSYFERWELLYMPWWYNFGHGVALRQPVVELPGECRHSNEIFIELGKRLVPDYFQFENDIAYYDIQLAGLGLSVEKLREIGGLWSPGTMGFRKYKKAGGFGTPSRKIHLYWEDLEASPWNQKAPRVELAPEYRVKCREISVYPYFLSNHLSFRIRTMDPQQPSVSRQDFGTS